MLFLTLMKVLLGTAKDHPGTLKRISSVAPHSGIKIHEVYFLFGRYDGVILFETPDLRTAKDFILRATTQTYTTETLSALPVEEL